MVYGTAHISSLMMLDCLHTLTLHQTLHRPLLLKYEGISLAYDTFSLARSYLAKDPWFSTTLLRILYTTGRAPSSEPRDKIYAALNLAEDGAKLVPQPDYSSPFESVCTNLAISIAQNSSRLISSVYVVAFQCLTIIPICFFLPGFQIGVIV
jgi:hypothetical protein